MCRHDRSYRPHGNYSLESTVVAAAVAVDDDCETRYRERLAMMWAMMCPFVAAAAAAGDSDDGDGAAVVDDDDRVADAA